MPPCSGPDHGDTSLSSTSDKRSCTPSDVKSRPFVLTSTDTTPGSDTEELLHTMDVSLTHAARTDVVLKRHIKYPSDSDTDWKPLPDTVTGVLASDTAVEGHTDDTAADDT